MFILYNVHVYRTGLYKLEYIYEYYSRKTNTFTFFPKRTWKILKNVQNAKEKNISFHYIVPCYLW